MNREVGIPDVEEMIVGPLVAEIGRLRGRIARADELLFDELDGPWDQHTERLARKIRAALAEGDPPDVSAADAVRLLNEALEADPEAIQALVESRVDCNPALAEHPTIQVGPGGDGDVAVGLLGILNGVFGATEHGTGYIAAEYENFRLRRFRLFGDES